MCGRFTLTAEGDVVAAVFELAEVPALSPRYNIAPTQPVQAVLMDPQGNERVSRILRWGLIPSWAKDSSSGARMINSTAQGVQSRDREGAVIGTLGIVTPPVALARRSENTTLRCTVNARAETVATKPAFRSAFRCRRCLIAADGFYEWQEVAGQRGKQPFYIRMTDSQPFAFAGLWERWEPPDGATVDSCTVITTEPNELLRPIHNRMPVILHRRNFDRWLDPVVKDVASLETLLEAYPAGDMTAFAVGTLVNNPKHDRAECIEPSVA